MINYRLGIYPKYHFVKFDVNPEFITLSSHEKGELKGIDLLNSILLPLSFAGSSLPYNGKIKCERIISVSISHNIITLRDADKGQITYIGESYVPYPIFNANENWNRLLNLFEKLLFPHLVNNIVREIIEKGEYEISKFYGLKVTMDGIYLGNKFIDIENVGCKINFKNWEIKLSNKRNIFQGRKITTSDENIIILPYLIDYLKIIHNQ